METNKTVERDWSSLVPELLNLIARYLTEISDFVRFRAVCTAWRFSTPITDLPPQFPWILETCRFLYEPHILLYSIISSKTYTIHPPNVLGKMFLGSSQGYMLTDLCDCTTNQVFSGQHTCQLSLLNLLNNHEITLPACDFMHHAYWIGPQQYQIGEFVVCFGYTGCQRYKSAFCCLGEDNWCELESDFKDHFQCFHIKNMFFRLEEDTGVMKVNNLTTGTLSYVLPPVKDYKVGAIYYPVDASGDILIVFKRYDCFDVHRLNLSGSSSPFWVKVKNIGNQALFIDSQGGFALEASNFSRVKANCIYFLDSFSSVKRIDIDTGDLELLHCPFEGTSRWFVPNLVHLQAK
ncbi:F-box domain-containing protein [Rhynchospora pubera]|uniref:F-box domain-containing protein n=1 Tax=Rhynchospora pubera TaxID=906938 RepID=A0AAV8GL66_9POAL|nr:F-box domain-containing protein [Rhynchospora pubera]